jgi:hypothetical protein
MPTETTVLRNALRLLGEPSNVGPDSSQKIVREIMAAWPDVVDRLFEAHDWNSFKSLEQLTVTTPAVPGWDYTFNKPAACKRIMKISNYTREDGPSVNYGFQAGKILTNHEETYCWFVDSTYQTQIGGWPQTFADLVAAHLADEVYPVNDEGDNTRSRINDAIKTRTRKAIGFDGATDPTVPPAPSGYAIARRAHLYSRRG